MLLCQFDANLHQTGIKQPPNYTLVVFLKLDFCNIILNHSNITIN